MDFAYSNEQDMLRDSARRYLADAHGLPAEGPPPPSRWPGYAALGWLALAAPEDAGGLGGSIENLTILAEELGRALSPEPFAASALLATRLVDRIGAGAQRAALIEAIAAGARRAAPALLEPGRRHALAPTLPATRLPDGRFHLAGSKILVPGGMQADALLVTARLDDGRTGLFLLDRTAEGVLGTAYPLVDGGAAADFAFDLTLPPDALVGIDEAGQIDDAVDEARLLLCADTLGCLDSALALTADYLKTRTQFGQPLANFQALQHSVAELYIECESVRSSLYQAIAAFSSDRPARSRAVSGLWVKTFDAAKTIAGMAVHLHGGIGFTVEYRVGHYLRRVMVSERCWGDVEYHLARYMAH